ncbi:GerAB/ArcD/ProY family transporter [Paenibacillus favisporus]|uniref:GerAB/ArcD/ProY family transporter n=1 Tax=Paenibacillus favisporus TaxID=221028 RepID=UPI002DBFE036|nr:GerAB/ArcD/ProY family transporter [Paenibacillus favisporus]MEC0175515.1 GerAB/ArcD/ProY family transporter [Paenibacillus favisporus]
MTSNNNWRLARFAFVYFNSQASIFLIPELVSTSSYQGIAGIVFGSLLGLIILFYVVYVGKLQSASSWVTFGNRIMGKGIHGAFVVMLLAWTVYYASYDIQSFVLFFGTNYLKGTPPWFIQLIISLVILYVVRLGARTLVYMSEGLFLLIFATTLLITYFYAENASVQMLPAFFHYFDLPTFFSNTMATFSVVSEWVVFLFLAPEFTLGKGTFAKLAVASVGNSLVLLSGWMFTLLNFSPHYAKQIQYPFLEIIRGKIDDGLLENSAPFMIGVWTASMLIHCSFLIYTGTKCMSYFTKGKGEGIIVPSLTLVSAGIAFYYAYHLSAYQKHYFSFVTVLVWIFIELIPLYYGIVAMLRLRSKKWWSEQT